MVEFAPLRFQSKILHDTQDKGKLWRIFFFKCCGLMRFWLRVPDEDRFNRRISGP